MALIRPYRNFHPIIDPSVFLAENATIIGEVVIGASSSIWYHTVLRGDVGAIQIGQQTNIQDGVIVHCTTGLSTVWIGNRVTVGHRAVLHGCHIEDEVLIGMGAIVLDNAHIPSHTWVAAGALVTAHKILEPGFIYAGIPAKKWKPISKDQLNRIKEGALGYVAKGEEYRESQ